MKPQPQNLREHLLGLLHPALMTAGIQPEELDDSFNLVESGLLDSIAFLNLITKLEQILGVQLALFDVDPERLTSLGGLLELLEDSGPSSLSLLGGADG